MSRICPAFLTMRAKTTTQLLSEPPKSTRQPESDEFTLPEAATLRELDAAATEKLGLIVRHYSAGKKGWQGYDPAEIEAARELLGNNTDAQVK